MTSYREAGVDLDGADRHTHSIADAVTNTWKSGVVGGFGAFAAGVTIPDHVTEPVLMMTTDGVGTKLELARRADRWDGVGFDLVAMCVDDLVTTGATSLGFVDYLAVGSLQPARDQAIVESVAEACLVAGCALLGGETAEHPGVMGVDAVDLAGAAMGVVDREDVLGHDRVREGDLIIGLSSPNVRSNGFSLIRSVLGDRILDHASTLLDPSVIYSPAVLRAAAIGGLHSAAHITGGGIAANLSRALPNALGATVDTSSWARPDVFRLISRHGVHEEEMRRTFNLGIGFCLIVDPDSRDTIMEVTSLHDPTAIGVVTSDSGVELV